MAAGKSKDGPVAHGNRREWLMRIAAATGTMAVGAMKLPAHGGEELLHTAEAIHQEVAFKVSAKRVYEALTDAPQFQKVQQMGAAMKSVDTAKPVVLRREEGAAFSLFGDYVTGRQIELVPNQRIVQAWRAGSWPAGVYSVARFELSEQGTGTKLVFDHTGFPAGTGEHLAAGWKLNYWEPLEKYFG